LSGGALAGLDPRLVRELTGMQFASVGKRVPSGEDDSQRLVEELGDHNFGWWGDTIEVVLMDNEAYSRARGDELPQ